MRAALDPQGNLLAPSSLEAARLRLEQLRYEIKAITEQLCEPGRLAHLGEMAYDAWCRRARGARRVLGKELKLLEAWVEEFWKEVG